MGSSILSHSAGFRRSSQVTSPFFVHPLFFLGSSPRHRAGITVRKMAVPPAEVLARLGDAKTLEGLSDDDLKAVLKEYYERWVEAESTKYDVERDVHIKEMQIHDLEMEVSDMRGKFILPKLKKVHNFKLMGGEE